MSKSIKSFLLYMFIITAVVSAFAVTPQECYDAWYSERDAIISAYNDQIITLEEKNIQLAANAAAYVTCLENAT